MNPGIFKPAGNINHQPQVMFYQDTFGPLFSPLQCFQRILFFLAFQRRRQHITAANVMNTVFLPKTQFPQ